MMLRRVKYFASSDSVICAEMLSNSSSALWKDMEEGKSRCLIRLERHQEALDCASQLVCNSVNVVNINYLNLTGIFIKLLDDLKSCRLHSDVFLFTYW